MADELSAHSDPDRPSSERKQMRDATIKVATYDPEVARVAIVERALEPYTKSVIASVTLRKPCDKCGEPPRPSVGALRHFSHLAKLVGLPPQINLLIQQQIGSGVEEARASVQIVRGASDDAEEVAAQALEYLTQYERRRGNKVMIEPFAEVVSDEER